jgi:hypothetical protein
LPQALVDVKKGSDYTVYQHMVDNTTKCSIIRQKAHLGNTQKQRNAIGVPLLLVILHN